MRRMQVLIATDPVSGDVIVKEKNPAGFQSILHMIKERYNPNKTIEHLQVLIAEQGFQQACRGWRLNSTTLTLIDNERELYVAHHKDKEYISQRWVQGGKGLKHVIHDVMCSGAFVGYEPTEASIESCYKGIESSGELTLAFPQVMGDDWHIRKVNVIPDAYPAPVAESQKPDKRFVRIAWNTNNTEVFAAWERPDGYEVRELVPRVIASNEGRYLEPQESHAAINKIALEGFEKVTGWTWCLTSIEGFHEGHDNLCVVHSMDNESYPVFVMWDHDNDIALKRIISFILSWHNKTASIDDIYERIGEVGFEKAIREVTDDAHWELCVTTLSPAPGQPETGIPTKLKSFLYKIAQHKLPLKEIDALVEEAQYRYVASDLDTWAENLARRLLR